MSIFAPLITKLASTSITAAVNTITTETTIMTLSVTVPSGGHDVMLVATAPQIFGSVAAQRANIRFKESTTILEAYYTDAGTNGVAGTFTCFIAAPSAGSHTYTLTATRDVGAGNISWFADNVGSTSYFYALQL